MKKITLGLMLLGALVMASCGQEPQVNTPDQTPVLAEEFVSEVPESTVSTALLSQQALNSWPVLKEGMEGQDVETLQYLLRHHDLNVDVDGDFGNATDTAIKAFQKKSGLIPHGTVDKATWNALIVTVKRGSKGEAVQAVQNYLGKTEDGIFGPATEAAVENFQRTRGLKVDGIVGDTTWQALVAGITTPKPSPVPVTGWKRPTPHIVTTTETVTRAEMMARGQDWVTREINYDRTRAGADSNYYRHDCSGFVSWIWGLPNRRAGDAPGGPDTKDLWDFAYTVAFKDIQPGDVFNSLSSREAKGKHNHVIIFAGFVPGKPDHFYGYHEWRTAARQEVHEPGASKHTCRAYMKNGKLYLVNMTPGYQWDMSNYYGNWTVMRKKGM